MSRIFKCTGCKKEVVYNSENESSCYNIGDISRNTNLTPVFGLECKTYWLCKDCLNKASDLAKQLIDIFGGDNEISLSEIYRKGEK